MTLQQTSMPALSQPQPGSAPTAEAHQAVQVEGNGKRILIIDDHPLMRGALAETLRHLDPDCRLQFADSCAEALRRLAMADPCDLILLDLRLPDSQGLDALMAVREVAPETPLVVLSGETARETILECIEYGAIGYVPKTLASGGVSQALRMVLSGHIYVPLDLIATAQVSSSAAKARRPRHGDPHELGLTQRQVDVLKLILQGLPNKVICRKLDLAEGTVKVHVAGVLRSLGVNNRTQAVVVANQLGLRFN